MSTDKSRICVMGLGWLGISLAERLQKDGHEVFGTTTSLEKTGQLRNLGLNPSIFKMEPGLDIKQVMPLLDCEILILNVPQGRKDQGKNFLEGLKLLTQGIAQSSLRHVLYISSTRVYRECKGEVNEFTSLNPSSDYGKRLLEAEELIHSTGKDSTTLRLAGLIGGRRHPIKMLQGKKGLAGGYLPTNLIHRADVIGLIEAIIEHQAWKETLLGVAAQKPQKKLYYPEIAIREGLVPPIYLESEPSPFPILDNAYTREKLAYTFKFDDPFAMPFQL
ncbi:MAG: NAD(P)H-binding protein [Bacteroidia bacterium]|nr:NAD(P)H-binding protein [Bacteroidia bacterium]